MLGAIIGDVIGSRFERYNTKSKTFDLYHEQCKMTDDSVLTIAVADAYMNKKGYAETIKEYGRENPTAGYGSSFIGWLDSVDSKPYNSWGNGSAMRVSALSWLIDDLDELMKEAEKSAEVTHNHPEGIKGAKAIAMAVWMARKGKNKEEIKVAISEHFGYDLTRTVEFLVDTYQFDVSCQGSVPEAVICFLESTDFEDCIRTAISIGGDSDTIASMAAAIAEAFYGISKVPVPMELYAMGKIVQNQKYSDIFEQFLSNALNKDGGN